MKNLTGHMDQLHYRERQFYGMVNEKWVAKKNSYRLKASSSILQIALKQSSSILLYFSAVPRTVVTKSS